MPMTWGAYSAPNSETNEACDCHLSVDGDSLLHSAECTVSKMAFVEMRKHMDFGSSLPSFAYEWDSLELDPTAAPELTVYHVAALLEEQRMANLIAIANGVGLRPGLRILARGAVIERLDVDLEYVEELERKRGLLPAPVRAAPRMRFGGSATRRGGRQFSRNSKVRRRATDDGKKG